MRFQSLFMNANFDPAGSSLYFHAFARPVARAEADFRKGSMALKK